LQVEKNRQKFPLIKDNELASRKKIVKNLQDSIKGIVELFIRWSFVARSCICWNNLPLVNTFDS
jgi:hypothetical protein